MKVIYLFFFSLLFVNLSVNAQKTTTYNLDKKISLLDLAFLNSGNVVLKTGRSIDFLKERNLELVYFDGLDVKWKVKLSPIKLKGDSKEHIVSSSDGSLVYHLMFSGDQPFNDNSQLHISQISDLGNIKEILIKDFPTGYLQSIICGKEYLYFICTEKNLQNHKKKKVEERIIISRYSHDDFTSNQFIVKLPEIQDAANSSFWEFVGKSDDNFYFVSKVVSGKGEFHLASVEENGELSEVIKVRVPLEKDFVMPSYNLKSLEGGLLIQNNDFRTFITGEPTEEEKDVEKLTNNVHVIHENGSFGCLRFFPDSKTFYIYGLYGPHAFRSVGNMYEGFFVSKYDLNGNKLFTQQFQMPQEVIDDSFFRIMATPSQRGTFLDVIGEQITFRLWFKNEVHNIVLNDDGEVKNYYTSETKNTLFNENYKSFHPNSKTRVGQYADHLDNSYLRKNKVIYRLSEKGEFIIKEDVKAGLVELMLFE